MTYYNPVKLVSPDSLSPGIIACDSDRLYITTSRGGEIVVSHRKASPKSGRRSDYVIVNYSYHVQREQKLGGRILLDPTQIPIPPR
jgi:hypothetical protein